jgi:hypothetical protein
MSIQTKSETMSWVLKIGGFIMSIAVAVSSYFLNSTMNKINELDKRVNSMELSNAAISGNRFTSNDWTTAKAIIDADRNAIDRRIVRLEENSVVIKDSLVEIKQILKETK